MSLPSSPVAVSKVIACLLLVGGISTLVVAEEPTEGETPLPGAETLLEERIVAVGGRDALLKLEDRVTTGTVVIPAMSIEGFFKAYEAAPNKRYASISLGAMGDSQEGTDGTVAWDIQPMRPPTIKEGAELARVLRQADFHGILRWRDNYDTVACVAVEEDGARTLYKIELTPPEGKPEHWFIDSDTHLVVKTQMTVSTAMGQFPVVSAMDDFREVDGVLLPHSITQTIMGNVLEMRIRKIEHNVGVQPERFELPPAVKDALSEMSADADQ